MGGLRNHYVFLRLPSAHLAPKPVPGLKGVVRGGKVRVCRLVEVV